MSHFSSVANSASRPSGAQRWVELDVEIDAEAEKGVDDLLLPFTQGLVYF